MIRAVVGLVGSTAVAVKVALGNFAVSKKSGAARCSFRRGLPVTTPPSGTVTSRRLLSGAFGSRSSLPDRPVN